MRGGQITIFVVVGLVLLFTIGLFYAVISMSSTPPETNTDTGTAVLTSTIASCVDSVVIAELKLLGSQGGLVEFEGWPHATMDDGISPRKVVFGITKNTDDLLPKAYDPPRYPDSDVTFKTMEQDIRTGKELIWFQDGYFGDVNFPAICESEGPNGPRTSIACRFYPGDPPNSPGPSVQKLLGQRIQQRVQACASPSAFEAAMGQDVQNVGEPKTEVTFTRSNTIVSLEYPLELKGGATTERFVRTYDVRFLPVMQFAIDLARADTRNVTFNVEKNADELPSYRDGFSVIRSKDVEITDVEGSASKADLITIIDGESNLDGSSFTFSFLSERRPPMLDPLQGYISCIAMDNTPLQELVDTNRIEGADPDDDPVEFSWCYKNPSLLGPCPQQYQLFVLDTDGFKDWETTDCYR